jgi:hypothetical protein
MLTLSNICAIASCTPDDVNNWMRRNVLRSPIPPTRKGATRIYSRENALEIAFVSALIRGGLAPSSASILAEGWIEKHAQGTLGRYFIFNPNSYEDWAPFETDRAETTLAAAALFLSDDTGHLVTSRVLDLDEEAPRPAAEFYVIDRAEIVRRVDEVASK